MTWRYNISQHAQLHLHYARRLSVFDDKPSVLIIRKNKSKPSRRFQKTTKQQHPFIQRQNVCNYVTQTDTRAHVHEQTDTKANLTRILRCL